MPKQVPPVPRGPRPIGPYSVAAEAGGLVFISGQVALDPATGQRVEGDAAAQAKRIMENLGLILGDLGLGFDAVVKTTIFLTDIADFAAVNEVYRRLLRRGAAGAVPRCRWPPSPAASRWRSRPIAAR